MMVLPSVSPFLGVIIEFLNLELKMVRDQLLLIEETSLGNMSFLLPLLVGYDMLDPSSVTSSINSQRKTSSHDSPASLSQFS